MVRSKALVESRKIAPVNLMMLDAEKSLNEAGVVE